MNKFKIGDRVVVDNYPGWPDEDGSDVVETAGTVTHVPKADHIYYDVRLDRPVSRLQDWLFSEEELRAE